MASTRCWSSRATPKHSPPRCGRVLGDGALAARLRAAGEERAQRFSMARLADEYVTIYRELVAGVRSR